MNRSPHAALLLLALATPAHAGARLEAAWWNYSISGTVDTNGQRIDLEHDVDISIHSRLDLSARWDTATPWVPDFTAGYFHIDAGGQRTVTTQNPFPLPPTTSVILADADLDDENLTVRWPWHDGGATLWGGIKVKRLDGDLVTRNQDDTQETRESVSQTFPMVHGAAEFQLGDRVTLGGALDWISKGDDRALEWRVGGDVRVFGPVGVTAAWQQRRYRVTTQNDALDTTLSGGLLGIYARW